MYLKRLRLPLLFFFILHLSTSIAQWRVIPIQQIDSRFTIRVERYWSSLGGSETYRYFIQNNTNDEFSMVVSVEKDLACVGRKTYKLGYNGIVRLKPRGTFDHNDDWVHIYTSGADNFRSCRLRDGDSFTLFKSIRIQATNFTIHRTITLSNTNLNFTNATGRQSITVSGVPSFTASSNASWLSVTRSGIYLLIDAAANTSSSSRSAVITVSADGASNRTINVTQAAGTAQARPVITLSTSSLNFTNTAGRQNITISGVTSFSTSTNASWLSLTRNGNTLTVDVAANTSSSSRSAVITVSSNGADNRTINVTQTASATQNRPIITLSTYNLNFSNTAGRQSVTVSGVTSFTASSNASWLSVTRSGIYLLIDAAANTSSSSRSAVITVSSNGADNRTINVAQPAGATQARPVITLSTSSLNFTNTAGRQTIAISGVTSFNASANASWLSLTRNGNTLVVDAAANTSSSSRSAVITVSSSGADNRTINVTQAAGTTQARPVINLSGIPVPVFTSNGGVRTIVVSGVSSFSASTSSSWISLSRSGNTLTIRVSANPSTIYRGGRIVISSPGATSREVIIGQDGRRISGSMGSSMFFMQEDTLEKIEKEQNLTLTVFPNPTSDNFEISLPQISDEELYCVIVSNSGEVLWKEKISGQRLFVNSAHWQEGTYYVNIQNEKKVLLTKRLLLIRK